MVASMHCIGTENHEILNLFDDECIKLAGGKTFGSVQNDFNVFG